MTTRRKVAPKPKVASQSKAASKPSAATNRKSRVAEEDLTPAEAAAENEEHSDADERSDEDGGSDELEPLVDVTGELVDGEEDVALSDNDAVKEPKHSDDEEHGVDSSIAISRHDPLQAYLREVQRHPLLTPQEEHALAVKYTSTQDVDAAARLVTANLRLVVKIAYEYRRAYRNIMDLIQEGNIGLMQAVKKYDPNRGVKLSSYSAWWIRAYILRFVINNWRLVKLGTTQAQRKLFFNLNKEKAKLSAMGIDPTPSEVARRLNVDEQEAIDMDRRLSSGEMSLDAPMGDTEGRSVARVELLPSANLGPDAMVADEQVQAILREKLAEFRKTLKGKDVDIFDRRLMAEEPLTLQELGDHFGISRERVRQIESRLTMNLRSFLKEALGDAMSTS